jgi:hypothetical protein
MLTFKQLIRPILILAILGSCNPSRITNPTAQGNGNDLMETLSPYAAWTNGPSTASDYFPIGVWLQDPRNATAYKDIGINHYVGLWQGPTQEQLEALKAADMRVICAQNDVGLEYIDDPIIIGWMHGDEPDNAQRQADGSWGGPVPTEKIRADYQRLKAADPSRPIWLNLGQGVANDEWVGRAAAYEDYPLYLKGSDIASFDVYPVAGIRKDDGERFLWYVAQGVDRLRQWSGFAKPVWNIIETTRINSPDHKATPHQVEAQVWMSLIHGSRGIVYFVHEWEPRFVEARLLEDTPMRQAVARINQRVHALAPVLNSPSLDDRVQSISAQADIPIDSMVKQHGNALYIFSVPMRLGPTTGSFTISGLSGDHRLEVLDESRSITATDGRFTDDFSTYEVHIYRLALATDLQRH